MGCHRLWLFLFLAVVLGVVAGSCATEDYGGNLEATNVPASVETTLPSRELDIGNGVTMKLVWIPPGEFMMGSPNDEEGRFDNEGPQHVVRIAQGFYMGIHEVTQEQYKAVTGNNPSDFKGPKNPVEQVSWNDAMAFCKRLSAQTGMAVRLPTEAEWEYACRAGTTTRFCFGDQARDLDSVAWYAANSDGKTRSVGLKKPNAFGLYDMHGNVWEWCADCYDEEYYGKSPVEDPQGPAEAKYRVLRGGSWRNGPRHSRSAQRFMLDPPGKNNPDGFRVVVEFP